MTWTDPRTIDWKDGLNPLARPAFSTERNAYVNESLNDPLMYQLRQGPAEMHIYATPDAANSILGANNTYDQAIAVAPDTWIIGFSAASSRAEGFTVQIHDSTGELLFSKPVHHTALQGKPVFFCPQPKAILVPQLNVKLLNLAAVANTVQLCIWTIRET